MSAIKSAAGGRDSRPGTEGTRPATKQGARPQLKFESRAECLKLLKDEVMDVRKAALENLPCLVEKGDRSAIRAILQRMWGDISWAVRLASIVAIEKVAHVGDEQALLGLVARITDPEAARGGQYWVRTAAREVHNFIVYLCVQ
jgi:hypothetical protein